MVTNWKAARQFQVIKNLPSKTLTQETLKKEWEGAVRTLSGANFATAFSQWYERCGKCVRIPGRYVEKTKNTKCPNYNCFFYWGHPGSKEAHSVLSHVYADVIILSFKKL